MSTIRHINSFKSRKFAPREHWDASFKYVDISDGATRTVRVLPHSCLSTKSHYIDKTTKNGKNGYYLSCLAYDYTMDEDTDAECPCCEDTQQEEIGGGQYTYYLSVIDRDNECAAVLRCTALLMHEIQVAAGGYAIHDENHGCDLTITRRIEAADDEHDVTIWTVNRLPSSPLTLSEREIPDPDFLGVYRPDSAEDHYKSLTRSGLKND